MLSDLTPDTIGNFLQGVVLVVSAIGFVGFAVRKKWREWREGTKTPRVDSDTFAKNNPPKVLPDPVVVQQAAPTAAAIVGMYQDLSQEHAVARLGLRAFRRRTWQLETSLKDNGLPIPAPFPDDAEILSLPLDQNGF